MHDSNLWNMCALLCFALLCLLTCLAKFLNLIGNDIVNKGHEELDCFFRVVEFVTCGTSGLRFLRRKAVLKRFFLVWGRVKHPTPVPTPPPLSPCSISAALFRPVYAPSREETAERVSGKACLKSVERFDNFCSFWHEIHAWFKRDICKLQHAAKPIAL